MAELPPATRSLACEQTQDAVGPRGDRDEAPASESLASRVLCCLPRCVCASISSIGCDEQTCMLYSRLKIWEGCAGLWTKLILFGANLFATFPWCLGFHVVRIYVGPWAYYTLEALFYQVMRLVMCAHVVDAFRDEHFPATDESLGALDATVLTEPIAWRRWGAATARRPPSGGAHDASSDTRPSSSASSSSSSARLFEDGVDMSDVCQGRLENCWLLSAVACLCQFEGAIQNLFIDKQANPRGKYRLRLYDARLGRWRRVTVDDRIPVRERTGAPVFSRPHGQELWVLLLEKAMAKHCGSYAAIEKGDIVWAFEAMTGDAVVSYDQVLDVHGDFVWDHLDVRHVAVAPDTPPEDSASSSAQPSSWNNPRESWAPPNVRAIALKRKGRAFDRDSMFELVRAYYRHGAALGAGSRPPQEGSRVTRRQSEYRYGIVPDHAYSIISADEYAGVRLVRLRNPWGSAGANDDPNFLLRRTFVWRGDWSRGSAKWTERPDVARAVEHRELSDREGPLAHLFHLRRSSSASPGEEASSSKAAALDVTFYMSWDDFCKNFNVIDVCVRTRGMNELMLTVHEEFGILGPTVGCVKGLAYFLLLCCGIYKMWCGLIGTDAVIESIEDSINDDDLSLAQKLYSVWFGGAAPSDVWERARQTYRIAKRPSSTSAAPEDVERGAGGRASSASDGAGRRHAEIVVDTGLPLPRTDANLGYRLDRRTASSGGSPPPQRPPDDEEDLEAGGLPDVGRTAVEDEKKDEVPQSEPPPPPGGPVVVDQPHPEDP